MEKRTAKRPTGAQTQHAYLLCPSDRAILDALVTEVEESLSGQGSPATVLEYGVSPKRQEGFLLVEAACGITAAFYQWLQRDPRILDYTVYDVPGVLHEFGLVASQDRETLAPVSYQSHLPAPALPAGYTLLSTPVSLDAPSDERWIALVRGEDGTGIVLHEEHRALVFLASEEAMQAALYLFQMHAKLQDGCAPGYLQAYEEQFTALRDFLSRRAAFCSADSLEELDAWCARHGLRLVPNDDAEEEL